MPPEVVSWKLYGLLCVPLGKVAGLVMASVGQEMVMENAWETIAPTLSVTWIVGVDIPAIVGVPDRVPLLASDKPVGKEPETNDQK